MCLGRRSRLVRSVFALKMCSGKCSVRLSITPRWRKRTALSCFDMFGEIRSRWSICPGGSPVRCATRFDIVGRTGRRQSKVFTLPKGFWIASLGPSFVSVTWWLPLPTSELTKTWLLPGAPKELSKKVVDGKCQVDFTTDKGVWELDQIRGIAQAPSDSSPSRGIRSPRSSSLQVGDHVVATYSFRGDSASAVVRIGAVGTVRKVSEGGRCLVDFDGRSTWEPPPLRSIAKPIGREHKPGLPVEAAPSKKKRKDLRRATGAQVRPGEDMLNHKLMDDYKGLRRPECLSAMSQESARGHTAVAALLLERGAEIATKQDESAKDANIGWKVLEDACKAGSRDVVALLSHSDERNGMALLEAFQPKTLEYNSTNPSKRKYRLRSMMALRNRITAQRQAYAADLIGGEDTDDDDMDWGGGGKSSAAGDESVTSDAKSRTSRMIQRSGTAGSFLPAM
mmetsp:Transcript_126076/g.288584  ORF Transcript_126076/g.288584 Transcript_126076/m.288584 type:complete len:452 (-) Transcript_126076:191-1546(-)